MSLRDGMHETDSTRVARTDALNSDVWYDETLVSGDRVYVVGYRYSLPGETANPRDGATEINAFRLANGHFERLTTTFIESWDYYSANNYASRLVDGRLVFYMPFSAMPVYDGYDGAPRPQEPRVPHRLQYDAASNRVVDDGPLFEPGDVFRPFTKPASPMFHSVVRCALPEDGSLQCLTTAVLGDFAREFYVSPTHVYVWTGDRVVMMGLRDGNVSAHSVSGDPSDQFAFHEANAFTMLRLPLSSFDDGGSQSLDGLRTRLGDASYASAERWVGDTFVAAVTPPARPVPMPGPNAPYAGVPVQPGYIVASSLVFFDAGRNGVRTVSINGPVQRIEAAGARALVAVEVAGRRDLR
ncbi:MAG TPA: hypothetical protein VFU90_03480, partial [Candidatus Tumulicola sp.]|nr:hypothetical protein [Candidatus Tumulicola sp.]